MSPWHNLLASDVDQSLITMTGFNGASFESLLQKFAPLFDEYTPFNTSHILLKQDPSKGGRPRKVRPEDCLGLVLVWTRTRGSLTALQLIFGMTCSNLCMYLRFGRRVIVEALKRYRRGALLIWAQSHDVGVIEKRSLVHSNHFNKSQ
jgi:hypothetical protein